MAENLIALGPRKPACRHSPEVPTEFFPPVTFAVPIFYEFEAGDYGG